MSIGNATQRRPLRALAGAYSRELALVGMIAVLAFLAAVQYPRFATYENFSLVLRGRAADGVMAVGMMLLLVGGAFDLSVGGMFALAGIIAGYLMNVAGWPVPLAVTAALACSAGGGLLNGLVVALARVNPLITTLGTMGIFRGLALLIGGTSISNLPRSFSELGQAEYLGLQSPVWLMIVVAALFSYLMARTRFFRQYYYIGSNQKAAYLSGINVPRMQIIAFAIMGLLAGLSGIAFAARIGTSVTTSGDGAELRVITAVILGGASLTGGKGTVIGALLGVAFVALVENVLLFAAVPPDWQSIIIGVVLVLAVATDSLAHRTER